MTSEEIKTAEGYLFELFRDRPYEHAHVESFLEELGYQVDPVYRDGTGYILGFKVTRA